VEVIFTFGHSPFFGQGFFQIADKAKGYVTPPSLVRGIEPNSKNVKGFKFAGYLSTPPRQSMFESLYLWFRRGFHQAGPRRFRDGGGGYIGETPPFVHIDGSGLWRSRRIRADLSTSFG
jgi:hypothetical protein